MKYIVLLTIFLLSCTESQDEVHVAKTNIVDHYTKYDDIIQQDLENKQRELNLLREIRVAQQNEDEEAYQFFMEDFYAIPRLVLTEDQKKHPKFKEWIDTSLITSGEFMDSSYDYITK
tara:strand:+ start:644 stop:997 length:354 start_codon:yes stop_codon:yes gene_type:complete